MTTLSPESYADQFQGNGRNAPLNPNVLSPVSRIGQSSDGTPGNVDHLKPVRLDDGLQTFRRISQRNINKYRQYRDEAYARTKAQRVELTDEIPAPMQEEV